MTKESENNASCGAALFTECHGEERAERKTRIPKHGRIGLISLLFPLSRCAAPAALRKLLFFYLARRVYVVAH